jgi:hypothetical protein
MERIMIEKKNASQGRKPWFDSDSDTPLIQEYARKMDSFLDVVADGKVDVAEIERQEQRIVTIMKGLEPLLSDEAHGKVTELLCEVTSYDLMTTLHMALKSRSPIQFRG